MEMLSLIFFSSLHYSECIKSIDEMSIAIMTLASVSLYQAFRWRREFFCAGTEFLETARPRQSYIIRSSRTKEFARLLSH